MLFDPEDTIYAGKIPLFTLKKSVVSGLAVIIYTSGTTGKPKGAMLTHGNIPLAATDWKPSSKIVWSFCCRCFIFSC